METILLTISALIIGFVIGTLSTSKTHIEYITHEKFVPITEPVLSDEEAFLQTTIVFEGGQFTQKELMRHLKHIGAKVGKAKNKDKFFVRIPDYTSPIAINYFSYKYFKTI